MWNEHELSIVEMNQLLVTCLKLNFNQKTRYFIHHSTFPFENVRLDFAVRFAVGARVVANNIYT